MFLENFWINLFSGKKFNRKIFVSRKSRFCINSPQNLKLLFPNKSPKHKTHQKPKTKNVRHAPQEEEGGQEEVTLPTKRTKNP